MPGDAVLKAAVTVVTAPPEIAIYNAEEGFRKPLRQAVQGGAVLVVADLTGTGFMDAVGLGVLVGAFKLGRQQDPQCPVGVACSSEDILRLFRVMGLDRVLDIRGSAGEFSSEEAPAVTDIDDDWDDTDDCEPDGYDEDDGDDRYDEYKDDVAMGYINPDGSQREPDPPECDPGDSGRRCVSGSGGVARASSGVSGRCCIVTGTTTSRRSRREGGLNDGT